MRRIGTRSVAALGAIVVMGAAPPVAGRSKVKVVVADVTEQRVSPDATQSWLEVALTLGGEELAEVESARIRVKDARDSTGKNLVDPRSGWSAANERSFEGGRLDLHLRSPARNASSIRISGTAELFMPGRDPNSLVEVPGFQANPGNPIVSKGLAAAGVEVTVLTKDLYIEERKKNQLDEKKIAAIRAEAKARGEKDEEVEALLEVAKALDEIVVSEHGLYLRIPKASSEKIQALWLQTASREKIGTGDSAATTREGIVLRQIRLNRELPKDAVLVVSLFTGKSVVSVPFDVKEVPLP